MLTITIEVRDESPEPFVGAVVVDGDVVTSASFPTFIALVGWLAFVMQEQGPANQEEPCHTTQ